MAPNQLLFDRTISRPRPWWATLGLCVGLLGLPIVAATLDGVLLEMLDNGLWRVLLAPVVVSLYIILIAPALVRMGEVVLAALRSLTTLSEIEFQNLVEVHAAIKPVYEFLVMGVGVAAGLWLGRQANFDAQVAWLEAYWIGASGLMWGLLVWTIFVSLASTRVTTAAHRYLGPIDLFDLSPFEPISRQSLLLSLVFVGGITLSLFFSFNLPNLRSPMFWFVYLLLALVPVLVFFMNMRSTHQALAAEKNRQLLAVQRQLQPLGSSLLQSLEQKPVDGEVPSQLAALLSYEERLKETRTWPYNTPMLRSLFFSVLIPLATVLARLVIEVLKP